MPCVDGCWIFSTSSKEIVDLSDACDIQNIVLLAHSPLKLFVVQKQVIRYMYTICRSTHVQAKILDSSVPLVEIKGFATDATGLVFFKEKHC